MRSAHPLTAPQQSLQARQEDGEIERFWQIIVRACGEALQHILGAAASRKDQHGHIISCGPQSRPDSESIFSRQHNVEHDAIKVFFFLEQRSVADSPSPTTSAE